MAKRKVIWSTLAYLDMVEIMNYYSHRNKSKAYSKKLYKDVQMKLKTLDFSIALPQKTSDKKLFYFTHNHIFVGFDIKNNDLDVILVIDDRRNPELIQRIISTTQT
jgi:toxin YoeB